MKAKYLLFATLMSITLIGLSVPIFYVAAFVDDLTGWYRVENHMSMGDH